MQRGPLASETLLRPSVQNRKAVCVTPSFRAPIAATLVGEGVVLRGEVRDVSVDGVAVLLRRGSPLPLSVHAELAVTLKLPDGAAEVKLAAFVVRRETSRAGVLYALRFDERRSDAPLVEQRKLHHYVLQRQREVVVAVRRCDDE